VHGVEGLLAIFSFKNPIPRLAENPVRYPAGIALVVDNQDGSGGTGKGYTQLDSLTRRENETELP
jgi:hypothetical protein